MTNLREVLLFGDSSDFRDCAVQAGIRFAATLIELLEKQDSDPARMFCVDARTDSKMAIRRLFAIRSIEKFDEIPTIALITNRQTDSGADLVRNGFSACVTSLPALEHLRVEPSVTGGNRRLTYHDLELDPDQYKVWRGGRLISMPTFQFRLLSFLMRNPSRVFSRQELLQAIWRDPSLSEGAVTACMARLRRAISQPGTPELIRNARGGGYSLDVDASKLNSPPSEAKNSDGNKSVTPTSPQCHEPTLVERRPGG